MAEAAALPVGELVAGKYRIEGVLGSGGMATVFAAWHEELEQRVALKMLHAGLRSDPTVVKRFVREARNAARIQSEHVARIMDVGRMDDDRVYIVMEYLEGHDLSKVLKARGPLPVEDVVEYLVQACDAIAVGHSMGIVHRDLKPANLFLTHRIDGSTCVKVLDFGIAKAFDAPEAGELTSTTAVIGSPRYMAPEQMANARDVDGRADVWSLGVIAFRLLTKELPFHGDNFVELAMNVASRSPRALRELRPDVPPGLESAILRCLAREPDQRFADVGAFVQAIASYGPPSLQPLVERVARVAGASSPRLSLTASGEREVFSPPSSPPTTIYSTTSPTLSAPLAPLPQVAAPAKRRRGLVAVVAILALVGASAAVFLATRPNGASSSASSPEPSAPAVTASASAAPSNLASSAVSSAGPEPSSDPTAESAAPSAATIDPTPTATATTTAPKLPTQPPATTGKAPPAPKPSATNKGGKTDEWGWGE